MSCKRAKKIRKALYGSTPWADVRSHEKADISRTNMVFNRAGDRLIKCTLRYDSDSNRPKYQALKKLA